MTQTKAELLETKHQGDIRLGDANSSHYVGFKAPATVSSSLVWTLPAADGSANQFLQTNASGVLSWGTADTSASMPLAGGTFTGNTIYNDNVKAIFGTSSDGLELYHDGSGSYIDDTGTGSLIIQSNTVQINNAGGTEIQAKFIENGAAELYHNNVKKFETSAAGVSITGAATISTDLTVTGDLTVSGTTTTINTQTLDVEDKNVVIGKVSSPSDTTADGGGWTLKGATDKTFNWVNSTDAWTSSEHIHLGDNKKLLVGTDSDLQIYHNDTNAHIKNLKGDFYIQTNDGSGGTETGIAIKPNAAVELNYNNAKKLETTSGGINVTGAISVNGSPLSAAPEVTLTASGSISNNQSVCVNSSGQAVAVTATTVAANPCVLSSWEAISGETNSTYWSDSTYDASTQCIVTVYSHGSSGIRYYVGTVSTSGVSWGQFQTVTGSYQYRELTIEADGNGKVAFSAHRWSSWGNLELRIGTINSSAKTVSWGSDTNYGYAGTSGLHVSKPKWTTTNNLAIARRESVSSDDMIVEVFSVSGTSITNNNTQYSVTSGEGAPSLAYRNGKLVYVGRRRSANSLDIRVANVASNGTLTWGNLYNRTGIFPNMQQQSVAFVHDERFIVAFRDNTSSRGFSRIYSWTGSGAPAVSATGSDTYYTPSGQAGSNARVYYDSTLNRVVLAYRQHGGSKEKCVVKTGAVSGTSVTWDISTTPLSFHNTTNNSDMQENVQLMHDSNRNRAIVNNPGTNGSVSTYDFTSFFVDVTSTSTNGASFIGFSKGAYSNGQTATIAVEGNTTTQSSLTAGGVYYVQKDGTLSTTADTPSIPAGVALSSTKLLIKT